MEEEFHLLIALALVTGTALLGGLVAQRLRQSVLVGYLLGGILVGPSGMGLIPEASPVQGLASMGVAFLMFALGVELSLRTLLRAGHVPILTGAIQITATVGLWSLIASTLGWPLSDGVLFGYLIALSSTALVLKLLLERGELDSLHGRILVGIMVFQDLTLVPVMVVLASIPPAFAAPDVAQLLLVAGSALLKAVVVVGGMLFLGLRVVPNFLSHIARLRSRELFIIAIFALVIGTASVSVLLGLSIALGAFIAGMLVSETEYSHQALADVIPLRDVFASFFFVSIGMLTDLRFIADNLGPLMLILMALLVAKVSVPTLTLLLLRYPLRPALSVGAGLLSVGEFSFILAGASVATGLASEQVFSFTLAAALVTMLLAPAALSAAEAAYRRLAQYQLRWLVSQEPAENIQHGAVDSGHAVVCGFGQTGRNVVTLLTRRNLPCLVVDLDPRAIAEARAREIPHIYGDASSPVVLQRCGLERARVLILAISDPVATDIALRNALVINPRLDVVAQVTQRTDRHTLASTGNVEVVEPGFEASLEVLRHTLHRFGVSSQETQLLISSIRQGTTVL